MTYRRPFASRRRFVLIGTVASIVSAAVGLDPIEARAGNIWDGGSALNGNWGTAANWDADTLPDFATPITFAGNANLLTNNDLNAITVGGIVFDPLADAFTLRGNEITLNGSIVNNAVTNQTINLAMTVDVDRTIDVAGTSLTIGPGGTSTGVISGVGGITKTGVGTLTLGAVNTYTGATTLDGGTVVYTADNTVTTLNFGSVPTASTASTNTTALDLTNANLTATSMAVQSNTSAANTINIGTGKTLTVNGAVTVGVSEVYSNLFAGVRTALAVTGAGGNWVVNGGAGHFTVGVPRSNAATGGDPASTVDLTGLSNFTYNSAGELRVGGGNVAATLLLANTSNTIVAAQVRIGDSNLQPPGGAGNNNGGAGNVMFGLGSNVINANTIIIGATKSQGIVGFQDPVQGSITIAGQAGGTSTANITIGNATSATSTGALSQLNLDGHNANIEAGTVVIGRLGGSTGGTGNGSITFDTGTFNVVNMQLAVNATGTAPNGAVGIFTLGGPIPNNTSTAVLNVTNQFLIANRTNGTLSPATGTFVINGGTANINADILDASTTGDPTTRNTTLTFAAGRLDMMGHAIGTSSAPITTVNISSVGTTATLANLGGTGINGVGLNVNGGGILILDGTNTYTGTTIVGNGTVKLGTASAYPSGSALVLGDDLGNSGVVDLSGFNANVAGLGTVGAGVANLIGNSSTTSSSVITFNTGTTVFAGTIQNTLESGNRTVALNVASGALTLSGANTYTGPTEVNQGTLTVTGSITSAVNLINGGVLAGSGNGTTTGKAGNVTMATGSSIRPGSTGAQGDTGTLTIAGLVVNGGDIQLDLGVSSDLINVLGTANFTAASTITPSPAAAPGTYTVLTANSLTLGTLPTIVIPPNTRTSFTPDFTTPNAIKIVVTGVNKSLTWTGQANTTWVVGAAGPVNWNDGVLDERFFNADSVIFGNGPVNRNITITGSVVPTTVTVNNGVGNDYSFSGGAIDGGASITKSGAGKLTLASANTHGGGITLNAGTLNVNHSSALGTGTLTIAGGSLDNTTGAPLIVATSNPQNWNANFSFTGTNNLDLGIGGVTLNVSPVVTVDANTLTVSGVIGGAFALTKAGPGALSLGAANSMSGGVTLASGTLNINNANALGTGAFTIEGGTIDNTDGAVTVAGNPLNLNGDFAFAGTNPLNLGSGPVTLNADRTLNVAGNTLTIGGVISGTFGLTKTGNGTLILSGASTHAGAVNINAGSLTVTNAAGGASSLGALAGGGAVTVAAGATLDLSGNVTAQALNFGAKQFTIGGTGVGGNGAIVNNGVSQFNALQHVTLSADTTIGGSARFDIRAVPNTALNANLDLQNHTLTKNGTNQFSLVGVDVTDGDIVINQGSLSIETVTNIPDFGTNKTITFGAGTSLMFFSNTAAVSTVNRPMVFNGGNQIGTGSNNNNSTIGSNMTLNGDVTFTNFGGASATSTLTLTGNLIETGGPRSITKIGASRLVLAGNNSFTGATMVNAGGLIVSGALNGTSSVSVQSGALLGGKGTITTTANGSVTLAGGANLAPGDGAADTLTLALGTGSLDLSAAAGFFGYLQFELGPTADRVLLSSGNLNIGTGGLDLDDFTFTDVGGLAEGTYVLFDTNNSITGTLGDNLQANLLGFDMRLQFANGVGGQDDLVLVVIPEPQSAAILLAGLGVLAFRRRKVNA